MGCLIYCVPMYAMIKQLPAPHTRSHKACISIGFQLAILLIIYIPSSAGARTIPIDKSVNKIPIGTSIEYYEDRGGRLGIKDIAGAAMAGKWEKSDTATPNFGFTTSVYWVRFTLKNRSGEDVDLYLEQAYPLISHLRLFVPDGKAYASTEIGHAKPFGIRPVDHRSLVFPLTLKARASLTCYLEYRTESAVNIELIIWSREAFNSQVIKEAPILWMFYGILLVMFAYNFIIFLSIRDQSYLYCALYIISFCLFMMSLTGLAYQYLWPNWPWWSNLAVPFFMGIIIISIIQFARYMGEVPKYDRIIDTILKVIIAAGIVVSCLTLVINNYRISIISATALTGIAAGFGSIALIIFVFKYKQRAARNYLIAYMLFLAGVLLYVFKTFALLPDVFITNYGIQIGAVFNVVALSLGLTDRINVMKNNLLELNIHLEDKVRDRTEELEEAMKELEVVNETILNFNQTLEDAQRRAAIDMEMAANVQAGMLPKQAPQTGDMDIAFAYKPMSSVSGDFYDFYEIGGKLAGVGIFDVSGHGVASGLITMIARSIFFRNIRTGAGKPLNQVLDKSNRELINEIGAIENYLTGILLRFNGPTVEYVNAAHSDLICKKGETGEVGIVNRKDNDIRGFFLGVRDVEAPYEALTFQLKPNDVLLLYTDCLYEGRNQQGEEYGLARLKQSLKNAPDAGAREILDCLLNDFDKFTGLAEPADDLTVIVIKKRA